MLNKLNNMHKNNKEKLNQSIEDIDEGKEIEELSNIEIKEHLSEEFKSNLLKMMTEKYEENDNKVDGENNTELSDENIKKPKIKTPIFIKKFAIVFSLFIIISGVTFGKNITSFVEHLFSGQDKSVELAIEDGYYQVVDMDYIVNNGVGIKVDYVYSDDTCIYIAFNIETEEESDLISLEDIQLKLDDNIFYDSYDLDQNIMAYEAKCEKIKNKNSILLAKFYKLNDKIEDFNKLKIKFKKIITKKEFNHDEVIVDWSYEIKMKKILSKDEIMYLVNSENLLEKYSIYLSQNRLKISLYFNEGCLENDLKRKDVYLEDKNGEKFYCNDLYIINTDKLIINIPVDSKNVDVENLKLVINNKENENITFNFKRGD